MNTFRFTLDFSKCKAYTNIHDIIRQGLHLPDWYGANLDAFWDIITGLIATPADIEVIQYDGRNKDIAEYIDQLIGILYEAEHMYGDIHIHVLP